MYVTWRVTLSLICDRCYESIHYEEFFKYRIASDFDFCSPCFDVILDDFDVLLEFKERDKLKCDLREFINNYQVVVHAFDKREKEGVPVSDDEGGDDSGEVDEVK